MAESPDIDRLLEEGLSCYGAGDLEGALGAWQQVLAIEPGHVQATSYIGYVRENYDALLRNRPQAAGTPPLPAPGRADYQIEVSPADLAPLGTPLRPASDHEGKDEAWLMEQETLNPAAAGVAAPPPTGDDDDGDYELELADDPADDGDAATLDDDADGEGDEDYDGEEGTFGGTTREYQGGPAKDFQLEEATSSFHPEATPVGFASQETDVKKRDLGFVQPAAVQPPPADVQVRLRTPEVAPGRAAGKSTGKVSIATAPTVELDARGPAVSTTRTTQDLPAKTRPPGPPTRPPIDPTAVSQAEVVLQHAPTKDLLREDVPAPEAMDPRAPTRELGLRQGARPATSDDSPTREADVRAFREQHARDRPTAQTARSLPASAPRPPARPAAPTPPEPPPLPAEPVDASTAALLAEIDADAPAHEATEDRTRRRIAALLDRALAWNGLNEFDKAVAAIDLALSEDPGSALAQKLVHRNRDTIMMVFQNYLGPLDRQPQLARPLHELASAPINPRAAFLMSRIDGTLSLDEILDVSGMPRLEAYRYLCQLFLRGILK